MWRRAWLLALALALVAAPAAASARPPHHPSAARAGLRTFTNCAQLVGYARSAFAVSHGRPEPPVVPLAGSAPGGVPSGPLPPLGGTPTPSGASSPTSYSTTNNQEAGIDEPDVVKTDGSTIFVASQGRLYAIDVGGGVPRLIGSLELGTTGYNAQLLLRNGRLIAISSGSPTPVVGPPVPGGVARNPGAALAPYPYYGGQTIATEIDVHDPAAMKVTRTMTIDGTFVDARQNGSSARLVMSSQPSAIAYPARRPYASGWVPALRFQSRVTGRHYVRAVAACHAVRRPVQFSGLGMLTILTIDLDRGLYATDTQALMADARVVYGSRHSLYIATQKWLDPRTPVDRIPQSESTVIDRFDVTDPRHTPYVASGEVPGFVLNQFSMSEYNGYLRVATTSRPSWWSAGQPRTVSQSYVTVLASSGGLLLPVGQISGLGVGQQIYSVRFIQNVGYVVTFRQVDPLYTIDLSSPTAPRVAGKLELDGYSSYLHPIGSGRLLGIGQDVGTQNEPAGSQLELFDVSDPSTPKHVNRSTLGGGSSEAQYDHHAFLFWPPTDLAVLPVRIYARGPTGAPAPAPSSGPGGSTGSTATSPESGFVGAIGFRVSASGLAEVGRIAHDPINGYSPPIRRSIVIGNQLFTVSDGGVMASSLDTLARQAFVAFPQRATPRPGMTTPGARPR